MSEILNKRRITFKTKRILKAKKIRIYKSKSHVYIEALPECYKSDLTQSELNKMYVSFIELGRTLYNLNKDNISKIKIEEISLESREYILKQNPQKYIKSDIKDSINKWLDDNKLKDEDIIPISDHLLLNTHNWIYDDSLEKWLNDNFAPMVDGADFIEEKNKDFNPNKKGDKEYLYWIPIENSRLVDMAIFFYLVTYSIKNARNSFEEKNLLKNDPITFYDFIEIEKLPKNDPLGLQILNDIIYIYEINNIYSLYGYNKLCYNYETGEYRMERQYNDIYAVLWHIFKLFISDNYSFRDASDHKVSINICIGCGVPILGTKTRCEDCDINNVNERQNKSRKEKFKKLDTIFKLAENYSLNDKTRAKVNKYLKKTKTELYKCKKEKIDKLLRRIEKELNISNS